VAAILALLGAASWGVGDFFGGLAARRVHVLTVLVASQAVGLVGAAVWVTARAAAVVTAAHHAAGSTAVDAASPLHRRLRDVHTLTQHFLVKRSTLATAGAVLAGREVAVPVF